MFQLGDRAFRELALVVRIEAQTARCFSGAPGPLNNAINSNPLLRSGKAAPRDVLLRIPIVLIHFSVQGFFNESAPNQQGHLLVSSQ